MSLTLEQRRRMNFRSTVFEFWSWTFLSAVQLVPVLFDGRSLRLATFISKCSSDAALTLRCDRFSSLRTPHQISELKTGWNRDSASVFSMSGFLFAAIDRGGRTLSKTC